MSRFSRLLRLLLVIILLIFVVALAFVAYTQHEEQQQWKDKYNNTTQLQQYWENKYANATSQLPLTLSMFWFANSTVDKAQFMDSLHQEIQPDKTTFWGHGEAVTFWFSKCDVGNGTMLLHLPSYSEGNYTPVGLPFFDVRLCVPPYE